MTLSRLAKECRGGALLPAFLFLLWAQLFFALLPTWLDAPSYRYALVAAPLWCLMAANRFGEAISPGELGRNGGKLLLSVAFLCLLPLLVVRPLQQVDQFWRLPLWIHAVSVVSSTIFCLIWAFGWPHCRRLVLLCFLAMILVPLPSIVEAMIAGKLTTLVSQGVAAILPMVGYPVDMTGNAMVVNGHVLDVAEGCSGLRSFQASLMLGIFLGEFYRLSGWQRLILAGVSVGLAFLGNGVRIYYLTTVAYREGPEAESKVHDTAGITAVTVVYALIGLTGWWLSREKVAGKVVITRKGVNS